MMDSVALIGDGLRVAWAITLFGAAALSYGLAMATSHNYPTWLGWVGVSGGVVGLVSGFSYAFVGATSASKLLFAVGAGTFSLVFLYVGALLVRQSSAPAPSAAQL